MSEGKLLVSTQTSSFPTQPRNWYRCGRTSSKVLVCLVLVLFAATVFWFWSEPAKRGEPDVSRPRQSVGEGFVSSQACLECHPDQHASWHASYHRTMTQLASNESIMGPFAGEQVEVEGVKARFTREGEKYFAESKCTTSGILYGFLHISSNAFRMLSEVSSLALRMTS